MSDIFGTELVVFISCAKNSIGVFDFMDRKKKATILCIENRLYIKFIRLSNKRCETCVRLPCSNRIISHMSARC